MNDTSARYHVLTDETKRRLTEYLGLSLGFFSSVRFSATSSEHDIRNGLSRIYYAFFHVCLAFLLSQQEDIDKLRHNHGMVHASVGRRLGKYMDSFLRDLYRSRLEADYEPGSFTRKYRNDLERARADANLLLERASRNFHWIYRESRKVL
jgi:uncharacterized protein (UPF0332 family)